MKKIIPSILIAIILCSCGNASESETEALDIEDSIQSPEFVEEIIVEDIYQNPTFKLIKPLKSWKSLTSFTVDELENIWIGHEKKGLFKYSNIEEENYRPQKSEIGYLVRDVFTDSKGILWVAFSVPNEGIGSFDGDNWTFYHEEQTGFKNAPNTIREDGNGLLYFSSNGIRTFDGEEWQQLELPHQDSYVSEMDVNNAGDILIHITSETEDFLSLNKNGKWIDYLNEDDYDYGYVNTLHIDESGTVYAGSWKGLIIIGEGEINKFTVEEILSQEKSYPIQDISHDAFGNIWMSSAGLLLKYQNNEFSKFEVEDSNGDSYEIDELFINQNSFWVLSNEGLLEVN